MALSVIILAAGQGTRMHSEMPKVLQPLAGRPLLAHVLDTVEALSPSAIHVVYGYGGDAVPEALPEYDVRWVLQAEQLGTGHAVSQAMPAVADEDTVLILCGDVPLVQAATLTALVSAADGGMAVLTVVLEDPTGYGRIVRDDAGEVARIVEEKEADEQVRAIREVNTGLVACPAGRLRQWLDDISNDNTQGEYYLTDAIALATDAAVSVRAMVVSDQDEVMGVNDKKQLAAAEAATRARKAEELMLGGVTIADPARIDIRGTLLCGSDVFIDVDTVFEGDVKLGNRVRIGPFTLIKDAEIAAGTEVLSHTAIDTAVIGPGCRIGPFARIRPETRLEKDVRVGNFVEMKKSHVADGSKVNHLSYIGDSTIGKGVNVGAGTITCNYDGTNKYQTHIGDGAFIGSGTQLVAPVEVGANAVIGAGSTITNNAPGDELTVARARQTVVKDWKKPKKVKSEK
ncbi:MAG: bifunctional UDP-N-acetylglucosamine diphosphorylase/glucosamine-1-phosphate N-acetyltransferase GlmU [Gammaproteobacteria bacterium]